MFRYISQKKSYDYTFRDNSITFSIIKKLDTNTNTYRKKNIYLDALHYYVRLIQGSTKCYKSRLNTDILLQSQRRVSEYNLASEQ